MRTLSFVAAFALLPLGAVLSQPPGRYAPLVTRLLAKHEALKQAAWGIKVVNLATGAAIFSLNADHLFTPASNAKLMATAYALSELGPDHRFLTRLVSATPPDSNGVLPGDLVIIGGGDPTIADRTYTDEGVAASDPFAPIDALVAQLSAAGIKHIQGDIIGDDRRYVWDPYPSGWAEDDTVESDGAPVSPLIYADNKVTVAVRPADADGEPGLVTLWPETGYLQLTSLVTTGNTTRIQRRRDAGSRQIEIRGEVRRPDRHELSVDDPAVYFAHVVRERLLAQGIAVDGTARARHLYGRQALTIPAPEPIELARRQSPPLASILRYVNKESQNLHAEVLLREAALEPGTAITRAAALSGLDRFLERLGIPTAQVDLADGSGLSRLDLATPDSMVKVLRAMGRGEQGELWMSTLPIGGEDGTLRERFSRLKGVKIMAKTGTLRHVTALSGYLVRHDNQKLAFSIMVNNVNLSSAATRAFVDDLLTLFVK
jgi:serine-type D-Ala-D-Ala carboxypeptidase/endopeptidase (penicillin-binding protein 4)